MRHALLLICHAYSLRPCSRFTLPRNAREHCAAPVETPRGLADHPRPSDELTPDEVAELLDFPPGWWSRVALQVDAPPAREAVTRAFYADLRKRADELGKKKYRVDAPRGFLNVHDAPGDPWRLDNVVEQLDHGTVVTAVEESNGWVRHDMGGWSIKTHGGHAFLVPLDDDDVR